MPCFFFFFFFYVIKHLQELVKTIFLNLRHNILALLWVLVWIYICLIIVHLFLAILKFCWKKFAIWSTLKQNTPSFILFLHIWKPERFYCWWLMLLVVDTHACDQSNYAVIIPDEPIENSTLKDGIHIPSDEVAGLESLYLMRKNISVDWFGKGATEVVSTEIIGMEKRILKYLYNWWNWSYSHTHGAYICVYGDDE